MRLCSLSEASIQPRTSTISGYDVSDTPIVDYLLSGTQLENSLLLSSYNAREDERILRHCSTDFEHLHHIMHIHTKLCVNGIRKRKRRLESRTLQTFLWRSSPPEGSCHAHCLFEWLCNYLQSNFSPPSFPHDCMRRRAVVEYFAHLQEQKEIHSSKNWR